LVCELTAECAALTAENNLMREAARRLHDEECLIAAHNEGCDGYPCDCEGVDDAALILNDPGVVGSARAVLAARRAG
jgi:hypothetical protein